MLFAPARQISLVHRRIANPNVSFPQTVHKILHAKIRNVLIPARVLVAVKRAAKSLIIMRRAHAHPVIPAIPSVDVLKLNVSISSFCEADLR